MAQTAKIIDFQEQRKRREQPSLLAQTPVPMFPVSGMAWVPVFMMPVVVFGQHPFNA